MTWPEEGWQFWRNDRLAEYPCEEGKWRYDLVLEHPRYSLEEVPIERNPHSLGGYTGHSCFYRSGDYWSTIFPVASSYHMEFTEQGVGTWRTGDLRRMLVESGHPEPIWGERIELFSTSSAFQDESWGQNEANKFAYFRGRYWRITFSELLDCDEETRNQRRFTMRPPHGAPGAGVMAGPFGTYGILTPTNVQTVRWDLHMGPGRDRYHRLWMERFGGYDREKVVWKK